MGKTNKEVSKNNKYYIPGERQLELEHFCLQYRMWHDVYLDTIRIERGCNEIRGTDISDPTFETANKILNCRTKLEMVEKCLELAVQNEIFASEFEMEATKQMLKLNVTEKYSWIEGLDGVCARTKFYKLRRKFFWYLDKMRG